MTFLSFLLSFIGNHRLLAVALLIALARWVTVHSAFKAPENRGISKAFNAVFILLCGVLTCVGCKEAFPENFVSGCEELFLVNTYIGPKLQARLPHPAAQTGTNIYSTPYLEFQGNLTLLATPIDSSGYMYGVGLMRQSDCSLTEYFLQGYDAVAGTFAVNSTVPGYEKTLRSLAQLPAHAGTFPAGCAASMTDASSTGGVILGPVSGTTRYIAGAINPFTNTLITGTIDLASGAIVQSTVSSIPYPASVTTADLNGDGKNDLIVAGISNNSTLAGAVYVLLSNGDGTFETPVAYATGGLNTTAVTVADVNGDGKLDIVATGFVSGQTTNGVQTLLGKGDGTFQPAVVSTAVSGGSYIAAGDFNGDSKPDIVLSTGAIALGKGDGTFAAPAFTLPIAVGSNSAGGSVAVADFNNDGKLDIAANVPGGPYISIFNGKGDGTFATGPSYANIADSSDLTVADLDGDGNIDILSGIGSAGAFGPSTTTHTGVTNVLMGNGDSTFQSALAYPNTAAPISTESISAAPAFAVADFNADSIPDILAASVAVSGGVTTSNGLELLTGDGKGGFTAGAPSGSGSPTILAAADMNGDGNLDAVFADGSPANGPGSVAIAFGDGKGNFTTATDYPLPNSATIANLVIADFNHDGKPDVLVTSSGAVTGGANAVYLFLNSGAGILGTPILVAQPSTSPLGLVAGDLNGDGYPEFAITTAANASASTAGALLVYLNQSGNSFAAATSYSPGYHPGGLAIADMNKDGKLDLIVGSTDQNYTQGTVSVYLGNGDGSLKTPQTLTTPEATIESIATADIDGDGKLDVILGQNVAHVAFGNGDGSLQDAWAIGLSTAPVSIVSADINSDGHPDLLYVSNNSINTLLNLYGTVAPSRAATTTTLTSSSTSVTAGSAVTFTATVAPSSGTGTPTGTVTFSDAAGALGAGTLSSGVATFSTSSLAAGTYAITATYSGDATFAGSTSSAVAVTVAAAPSPADFTLGISPSSGSASASSPATATVTVTPQNGFSAAVALSCSGAPSGYACSLSPASVTPSGSAATSKLTLSASTSAALAPFSRMLHQPFLASLFFLALLIPGFRRTSGSTRTKYLIFLAALILPLCAISCGGGGSSGGSSTQQATISVTATSGTLKHAATYTATVTVKK